MEIETQPDCHSSRALPAKRPTRGRTVARLGALLVIVVSSWNTTTAWPLQEGGDELGAQEILQSMSDAYAALTTYRDTGQRGEKTRFSTVYSRPDQLWFSYESYSDYRGMWLPELLRIDGDQVLALSTGRDYGRFGSLLWITYETVGADQVMRLLASDLVDLVAPQSDRPGRASYLNGPVRGEDGELADGTRCFRVKGTRPKGGEVTLWIDSATFMLRRAEPRHGQYVDFNPELDPVLAPDWLDDPGPAWGASESRRFWLADLVTYLGWTPFGIPFLILGWVMGRRAKCSGTHAVAYALGAWFAGIVALILLGVLASMVGFVPGVAVAFALPLIPVVVTIVVAMYMIGYSGCRLMRRPRVTNAAVKGPGH